VEAVAGKLAARGAHGELSALSGTIEVGSYLISGQLETSPADGLILYRYARLKPTDLIRGWLKHLFLDRLAPPDFSRTTQVAGNDKIVSLPPVPDSAALLADLLALYRQGLMSPLRFFPATSQEFAGARSRGLSAAEAMVKATKKWQGDSFADGEADDRYYQLCFRNINPLNREFMETAQAFFAPLHGEAGER
jgi:exodeoxyribonuclease V gamma subunit